MSLEALPFTQRNLIHVLLSYPLHTFKVVAGIYWEAALLFLKKGATFLISLLWWMRRQGNAANF